MLIFSLPYTFLPHYCHFCWPRESLTVIFDVMHNHLTMSSFLCALLILCFSSSYYNKIQHIKSISFKIKWVWYCNWQRLAETVLSTCIWLRFRTLLSWMNVFIMSRNEGSKPEEFMILTEFQLQLLSLAYREPMMDAQEHFFLFTFS